MKTKHHQEGVVLIVALIFLLLISIVSSTVIKTSIVEVKMANNEQLAEEAFQQVQAVANAIAADTTNLVVAGDVGFTICATGDTNPACNVSTINLTSDITTVPSGAALSYRVQRMGPLFAPLPFRLSEANAGSAAAFSSALFEVNANYNGTGSGLGQAQIAQGIALRVANGNQ